MCLLSKWNLLYELWLEPRIAEGDRRRSVAKTYDNLVFSVHQHSHT